MPTLPSDIRASAATLMTTTKLSVQPTKGHPTACAPYGPTVSPGRAGGSPGYVSRSYADGGALVVARPHTGSNVAMLLPVWI
jgi:hypothetical protein